MTTAKDYARFAAQCSQLADQINPPEGDRFAVSRRLTQFHLRVAAKNAREISEALAEVEGKK